MTTPHDAPDNRSIDLEVEVPGTPEQVWEAIATGPGITAWMHPTEIEEREGGSLSFEGRLLTPGAASPMRCMLRSERV